MYDLVIRNGKIIDGSGGEAFIGDVAVTEGIIRAVGEVAESGEKELDAKGNLVTPGFVDVHTHYDGQIIWDPQLESSALHGVTTILTGNCGVGVAPAKPEDKELLMKVLEDVEDIPVPVLKAGMNWTWESFPEYLDVLEKQRRAIDVATQIGHIPLRCYVMGERGLHNEPATEQDIAEMQTLVKQAIDAGALGFTTSRTELHVTGEGELVPGTTAEIEELSGICSALKGQDSGIIGVVTDFKDWRKDMDWMKQLSIDTGCPVYFLVILRFAEDFDKAREQLAYIKEAEKEGAQLVPHVPTRPINMVLGFDSSYHPFCAHASYAEIASLPYPERLEKLKDPQQRAKILVEDQPMFGTPDKLYPQGDVPCYEPSTDQSVAALAEKLGRDAKELTYDLMLENDGKNLLFYPVGGYDLGDLSVHKELLEAEGTVLSLGDGGAHACILADASTPTYMLSYWARDRDRGECFSVEQVVKMQTSDTAQAIGLDDRGILAVGKKADINIIDQEKVQVGKAELRYDLPANGKRLFQGSEGYIATFVSGELTYDNGVATGAMPGRLVRGAQRG